MTHSTHFIYGYMVSDIWLRTILIVRKETRYHHIGYSYRLTARVLLYAPSHRQDNTYHGLCYTSRGALAGTRCGTNRPDVLPLFFSCNAFSISWAIRESWSSMLLCFLYPVCVCDRTLLSSKKDSGLLLITFSSSFPLQFRRLIGR